MNREPGDIIIIDDTYDAPLTDEQKKKLMEWCDKMEIKNNERLRSD